jgi:hypothetical protein
VRLHTHNGVLLRVEIRTSTVNLHADEKFVQFLTIPKQGLFRDKFQKSALLGGFREVLTLKHSSKFFSFFEEGNTFRPRFLLARHVGFPSRGGVKGRMDLRD